MTRPDWPPHIVALVLRRREVVSRFTGRILARPSRPRRRRFFRHRA
jgi:hypothetical protein